MHLSGASLSTKKEKRGEGCKKLTEKELRGNGEKNRKKWGVENAKRKSV